MEFLVRYLFPSKMFDVELSVKLFSTSDVEQNEIVSKFRTKSTRKVSRVASTDVFKRIHKPGKTGTQNRRFEGGSKNIPNFLVLVLSSLNINLSNALTITIRCFIPTNQHGN